MLIVIYVNTMPKTEFYSLSLHDALPISVGAYQSFQFGVDIDGKLFGRPLQGVVFRIGRMIVGMADMGSPGGGAFLARDQITFMGPARRIHQVGNLHGI